MLRGWAFAMRVVAFAPLCLLFLSLDRAPPSAPRPTRSSGDVSNPSTMAPGGENSAAAVAKKLGDTAQLLGTPGTIAFAPGIALTSTYIGEAAGNPLGGLRQGAAYAGQIFGGSMSI